MIRARVNRFIFIGLERENIERLQKNQPIHFKADDLNLPGWEVVILFGESNKDIYEDLRALGVATEKEMPNGS